MSVGYETIQLPAHDHLEAPATAQTAPERDRLKRSRYAQDTESFVGAPMSIQRVPEVPFAQIANSALRDARLSFKARGVLALVLSNVGDWEASLRWLCKQSEKDGRHAIQQALNELTELGYREVSRVLINGQVRTVVEWRHTTLELISRPTENPTVRKSDHRETGVSIEHHPLEHYLTEEHPKEQSLVNNSQSVSTKEDPAFDAFWNSYPRKQGKGAARKAWVKALTKSDPDTITAAALSYRNDPNREDAFTAHAATWLNDERWDDEPLPARSTDQSKSEQRLRRNVAAMSNWQPIERELEPWEIAYVESQRKELEA